MCTVTLEYKNSALARRKIAALLATGLFVQKYPVPKAPQVPEASDSSVEMETMEEHRQLMEAAFLTSKRSMAHFIERNV